MSIGDFVDDSITLFGSRRYESAMCLAMNALDATTSKEYPHLAGKGHVGERFEAFVADNVDVLYFVGLNGMISVATGGFLDISVRGPNSPVGTHDGLKDILYVCVRCFLSHEAALPPNTYFNEQCAYGNTPEGFSIPVNFICAVLLAVVGARTNTSERSDASLRMTIRGADVPVAECWGNKQKVRTLLAMP